MAEVATADKETVTPENVSGGETIVASVESLKMEDGLRLGDKVKSEFVEKFPIDKISAPDGFNIRIAKGQIIAGVRVEKDTRNIPGMVDSIRQLDGITDPIVMSEREDGETVLLQGYRRYNGALVIRSESPGTPLAEKLKFLRAIVYKGLTLAQERQMVNDQRSKSFSALEVYRWFTEQLDGGYDWMNVCRRCYHELGQVTGNAAAVKKIDDIQDEKERDKELRKWLTSYFFQWWVNSWKARPLLRTMTEQTYLFKEGITKVRPRVMLTSMRMRELWKQADADMKAGNWNRTTGTGPLLEDKLKFFEAEDNKLYDAEGNRTNAGGEDTGPKFRKLSEFKTFMEAHTDKETGAATTLVGEILGIAYKDGGAPSAVQEVLNYEKCKDSFLKVQANIEPKLRAGLNLLFAGGEGAADQFEAFLKDSSKPAETAKTEAAKTEAADGKKGKKGEAVKS